MDGNREPLVEAGIPVRGRLVKGRPVVGNVAPENYRRKVALEARGTDHGGHVPRYLSISPVIAQLLRPGIRMSGPRGVSTMPVLEAVRQREDVPVPQWLVEYGQIYHKGSEAARMEGKLKEYEEAALIWDAFTFAEALHEGQRRKSGAPYIIHPISVASLIRGLGGDAQMVAAGFLHDVVEDTNVTAEEIGHRFGNEVRRLVEGVTNLSKVDFCNREDFQAENFKKIFSSMAKDIRVIIVKLADRLHNMRTLSHLSQEKQKRIALETMDIYAPLASRLGLWRMKCFLEDLSFKYLEPEAYKALKHAMASHSYGLKSDGDIHMVKELLKAKLLESEISVTEVQTRYKHLYSLYSKMLKEGKGFEEVYDVASVRILAETRMECYKALGAVHDLFTPIPGRLKDQIALPKPNGYQSIHTDVIGPNGMPIEIQIRTPSMHHSAEFGIAAEWKFGSKDVAAIPETGYMDGKFRWLRQVLEWQRELKDSPEYYNNLKEDLFEDDVYVFTPLGDVVTLRQESTPVDFAYRVHTEVGNHLSSCKVNGRVCPLDTKLVNGDIVEVITSTSESPSLQWLNFAKTPTARNGIKKWFKGYRREENAERGRQILAEEFGNLSERILSSRSAELASKRLRFGTVDAMLAALGSGEILIPAITKALRETVLLRLRLRSHDLRVKNTTDVISFTSFPPGQDHSLRFPTSERTSPNITGLERVRHGFSWCCQPLPGEPVIGVANFEDGFVSIHSQSCHAAYEADPMNLVPVRWSGPQAPTNVDIVVDCINRIGIMRDIMSLFSDDQISLTSAVCIVHEATNTASARLSLGVTDITQLNRVFDRIRTLSDVFDVQRVNDCA